jgi:hypothetical protein
MSGPGWFKFGYRAYTPTSDHDRIALDLWPDRVNYRVHQAISTPDKKYVWIDIGEADTIARGDTERKVEERFKIEDPKDPGPRPTATIRPQCWLDSDSLDEYFRIQKQDQLDKFRADAEKGWAERDRIKAEKAEARANAKTERDRINAEKGDARASAKMEARESDAADDAGRGELAGYGEKLNFGYDTTNMDD